MKCSKKLSSFILCIVLTVTMALFTTGCNGGTDNAGTSDSAAVADVQDTAAVQAETDGQDAPAGEDRQVEEDAQAAEGDAATQEDAQPQEDPAAQEQVLGEGSTVFTLTVVNQEKEETRFEIHTDKKTVGEALLELGLIDGDQGDYGLYVKTVNGITVDYDKDGKYWAFYINDEYAQTGVDATDISQGDIYSLRVE